MNIQQIMESDASEFGWDAATQLEHALGFIDALLVAGTVNSDDFGKYLETVAKEDWSGHPDPADPDNFWIDDATGERVNADTGEREAKKTT